MERSAFPPFSQVLRDHCEREGRDALMQHERGLIALLGHQLDRDVGQVGAHFFIGDLTDAKDQPPHRGRRRLQAEHQWQVQVRQLDPFADPRGERLDQWGA